MHPPEIFQTRHVFNILIGKEQKREGEREKKNKTTAAQQVSHYGFCVAYLQTRALRINMLALNYLFPPGKSQAVVFECLHGLT